MLLRLLFSPLPTQMESQTFGTVVLVSLVPEETSAYPRKEDPIMSRSCAEHRVAMFFPREELMCLKGVFSSVMLMFLNL